MNLTTKQKITIVKNMRRRSIIALAFLFALGAGCLSCRSSAGERAASSGYASVFPTLEQFIAHEMEDKELPAVSIALVDDQQIVWANGFGFANPKDKTPATAETIYRVGSVSKLFTDIAVMQLFEQGKLHLDVPGTKDLT